MGVTPWERVVSLGDSAGHLEVDRQVASAIALDDLLDESTPFAIAMGIGESDRRQAALKTRQVLGQAQRLSAIARHQLVNPIAKDKAPIEHRDLGFF